MLDSDQDQGGAPWIRPQIQRRIAWREGDVVVSAPPKSGTTWTMNIVHQLRSGGDREFENIYAEVPWLEFVDRPERSIDEIVARFDDMPHDRRRVFKSHSAPPALPCLTERAQYVVVVRNPEDALASLEPFMKRHDPAWLELWQVPSATFVQPDFESFYREIFVAGDMHAIYFGFLAQWWPLRHRPNVLLLHFTDMKRDLEGSIRKVADFLGFEPRPEQWPTILECASFAWMKQHERRFEPTAIAEHPVLDPGAMFREGQVGAAQRDGVSEAIARDLAARGRELLPDEAAFEWLYRGGPIPTWDSASAHGPASRSPPRSR